MVFTAARTEWQTNGTAQEGRLLRSRLCRPLTSEGDKINDQQVALTTLKLRSRAGPERLLKDTPTQSFTACKLSSRVVSGHLIAVLNSFSFLESWTLTLGVSGSAHTDAVTGVHLFSVVSLTRTRGLHLPKRATTQTWAAASERAGSVRKKNKTNKADKEINRKTQTRR